MKTSNTKIELVDNQGEIEHLEKGFWLLTVSISDRHVQLEEGPFETEKEAMEFAEQEGYANEFGDLNFTATKNTFYIAGYLKGNRIGVVDSDGKFNGSEKLDLDSWMHFESFDEAQVYADRLLEIDIDRDEISPDFSYSVEEWDENYYSQN